MITIHQDQSFHTMAYQPIKIAHYICLFQSMSISTLPTYPTFPTNNSHAIDKIASGSIISLPHASWIQTQLQNEIIDWIYLLVKNLHYENLSSIPSSLHDTWNMCLHSSCPMMSKSVHSCSFSSWIHWHKLMKPKKEPPRKCTTTWIHVASEFVQIADGCSWLIENVLSCVSLLQKGHSCQDCDLFIGTYTFWYAYIDIYDCGIRLLVWNANVDSICCL